VLVKRIFSNLIFLFLIFLLPPTCFSTGWVRVARAQADALARASSYILWEQETYQPFLTVTAKVWLNIETSGDGVTYYVEQ